jgi:hypothetical protein
MTPWEFLKSGDYKVRFRWLGKTQAGEINFQRREISINLELFAAACFIHEFHHARHPKASEKRVLELETETLRRLTAREIRRLARRILQGVRK